MRINSSAIGMQSNRTYAATAVRMQRAEVTTATRLGLMGGRLFGGQLNADKAASLQAARQQHSQLANLREQYLVKG